MIVPVLIVMLASSTNFSKGGEYKECVAVVAVSDAESKIKFQKSLRDLTVRENRRFAELANLNMELQVALAKSRRIRLLHLLRTDTTRLNTTGSMSKFTNFGWSAEDTARLAETDAQFEAITQKISELKSTIKGHPDWPALHKFVLEVLNKHSEFATLIAQLNKARDLGARRLGDCRSR
ncbi:MAG: hypothetical protein ACRBM6_11335 [Geminicoccales bacterium]